MFDTKVAEQPDSLEKTLGGFEGGVTSNQGSADKEKTSGVLAAVQADKENAAAAQADSEQKMANETADKEEKTNFGEARTDDKSSSEKRGGRIQPHHYAAGGYAPISMQYGLPTQDELSQLYADYAGTGVGQLGAQQYAAAAKGVLPTATAAKGGRIGYANLPGGSGAVTDDDFNLAGNGSLNGLDTYSQKIPRLPSLDASPDNPNALTLQDNSSPLSQQSPDEIRATADTVADKLTEGESKTPIGRRFQSVFEPSGVAGGISTKSKKQISDQTFEDLMRAQRAQRRQEDAAATESQIQQVKKQAPSMFDPMSEAEYQEKQQTNEARIAALQNKPSGVGAGTPIAAYEPASTTESARTNPIIPKTRVGFGTIPKQLDASSFAVDPNAPTMDESETPVEGRKYAQAQPQTMNDATRDVAPGIKEWYNAPPPRDITQMNNLAFFARLMAPGAFGSNLANAANDYASGMMAQNAQERTSMTNQATAGHTRAQAGQSEAEAAAKRYTPIGLGAGFITGTGNPGDPLGVQMLSISPDGKTVSTNGGAGNVQTAGNMQVGSTPQAVPFKGEHYTVNTTNDPNYQAKTAELLTQLAHQIPTLLNTQASLENRKNTGAIRDALDQVQLEKNNAALAAGEIMDAVHKLPKSGPFTPGPLAPKVYKTIGELNQAAAALHIDLGLTDNMNADDIMKKFGNSIANQTSESKAARWIESVAMSLPNIGIQLPTIQALATNPYAERYAAQLRANTANKLWNESQGQDTSIANHVNSVVPADTAPKIQKALMKLMNSHQTKDVTDANGKPVMDTNGQPKQEWVQNPQSGRYETLISAFQNKLISPKVFDERAYQITGIQGMSKVLGD